MKMNNKFSERSLVYSDRSLVCPDLSLSCPVRSLICPERSLSYPVRSLVYPDLLLVYSDLSLIYADCSTGGSSRFVKNSGNFGIALLSAEDSALGSGSVIFVIFEAWRIIPWGSTLLLIIDMGVDTLWRNRLAEHSIIISSSCERTGDGIDSSIISSGVAYRGVSSPGSGISGD